MTGRIPRPVQRAHVSARERLAVAALAGLFASQYALYGLFRHWHFGSSYDLGIFDQAVWELSRFAQPKSSIIGVPSLFADHFHPIIVLFAPLYWIAPAPETLIVAQAMLLAASIVPVFVFLRSRLPTGPALTLSAAYGLFWGVQRAAAFDVHEVAFAPLLVAIALLAMHGRRWAFFWVAASALVLVKEDLIPFLTCLGMYLAATGERWRGAVLVASSLLAFVLIVTVIIPAAGGGGYRYAGAYDQVLSRPWSIPLALATPVTKLRTALLWVAPFALLPLLSPLAFLTIPFAMTRFLSENPTHWGTVFHYTAPLAPILAMAAGDGLARGAGRIRTLARRTAVTRGAAAFCLVGCAILPGNQPLWDLFSSGHYRPTVVHRTGYAALRVIPADASVVAQTAVVPHLSRREHVYLLQPGAPDAEFVIAAAPLSPWPNRDFDEIRALLDERRSRGYVSVFEQHGWVVLRQSVEPRPSRTEKFPLHRCATRWC